MLSALRLYADNLLCMDLCGWSGVDAIKLLGDEVTHSVCSSGACISGLVDPVQKVNGLRLRKEMGEIWGCRHMVEARHGTYAVCMGLYMYVYYYGTYIPVCHAQVFIQVVFLVRKERPPRNLKASHEM